MSPRSLCILYIENMYSESTVIIYAVYGGCVRVHGHYVCRMQRICMSPRSLYMSYIENMYESTVIMYVVYREYVFRVHGHYVCRI